MFDTHLCPQQLEEVSDGFLDPMITEQAEEHLDKTLYGLGQILMATGQAQIFMETEATINAFLSTIAEKAFAAGHEHGYGWAVLDVIETLRPIGLS